MLFLKTLVSSVSGSAFSAAEQIRMATDRNNATMAKKIPYGKPNPKFGPETDEMIESFHQSTMNLFNQMALLPKKDSSSGSWIDSPDSARDSLLRNSPKSLHLSKSGPSKEAKPTEAGSTPGKLSQFDAVASTLIQIKNQFTALEEHALAPDETVDGSLYQINLDRVSGLLMDADKLMARLQGELLDSQPNVVALKGVLEEIFQTLESSLVNCPLNCEVPSRALARLSALLGERINECINLLDGNQLLLVIASHFRSLWRIPYSNLQAGKPVDVQFGAYIEQLISLLTVFLQAPYGLASSVSIDTLGLLFESLLPTVAVYDNYDMSDYLKGRHLAGLLGSTLFSTAGGAGFDPTAVVTVLMGLLKKYAVESLEQPETDPPALGYPKLYSAVLGRLLRKASAAYSASIGLSYTPRAPKLDIGKVLIELNEPLELYSVFTAEQSPEGLDAVKVLLDSLIRSKGPSIWSFFEPLKAQWLRKDVDIASTALYKCMHSQTPCPQPPPTPKAQEQQVEPSIADLNVSTSSSESQPPMVDVVEETVTVTNRSASPPPVAMDESTNEAPQQTPNANLSNVSSSPTSQQTSEQALHSLLSTLRGTNNNPTAQQQVMGVLKSQPALMASFLKEREQAQQKLRRQKYDQNSMANQPQQQQQPTGASPFFPPPTVTKEAIPVNVGASTSGIHSTGITTSIDLCSSDASVSDVEPSPASKVNRLDSWRSFFSSPLDSKRKLAFAPSNEPGSASDPIIIGADPEIIDIPDDEVVALAPSTGQSDSNKKQKVDKETEGDKSIADCVIPESETPDCIFAEPSTLTAATAEEDVLMTEEGSSTSETGKECEPTKQELVKKVLEMQEDLIKTQDMIASLLKKVAEKENK